MIPSQLTLPTRAARHDEDGKPRWADVQVPYHSVSFVEPMRFDEEGAAADPTYTVHLTTGYGLLVYGRQWEDINKWAREILEQMDEEDYFK